MSVLNPNNENTASNINRDTSLFGGIRRQLLREKEGLENLAAAPWSREFSELLSSSLSIPGSVILAKWQDSNFRNEALMRCVQRHGCAVISFLNHFQISNVTNALNVLVPLIEANPEIAFTRLCSAPLDNLYLRREMHLRMVPQLAKTYLANYQLWGNEVAELRTDILLALADNHAEQVALSIDKFNIISSTDRERIFFCCLAKAYWETLACAGSFKLETQALVTASRRGILEDAWRVADLIPSLANGDLLASRLLALACAERDTERLLKELGRFSALGVMGLKEVLLVASRNSGHAVSEFVVNGGISDETLRHDLLVECAKTDPFSTLTTLDRIATSAAHRASIERAITTAALDLDALRLAELFGQIRFPEPRLNERLFLKAMALDPARALTLMPTLSINDAQVRFLAATRCASKAAQFVAEHIEQFALNDDQLQRVFLSVSANNPVIALRHALRFGISPNTIQTLRNELVQNSLRTDPFAMLPLFNDLEIEQPLRESFARACIQRNPGKVCANMHAFGIVDATYRQTLALECINRCPWDLLAHLDAFALPNSSLAIRLARQFGKNNPWRFIRDLPAGYNHQDSLYEIAEKCVQSSSLRALKDFPWLKLNDSTKRTDLLKRCISESITRSLPHLSAIAPLNQELEAFIVERGIKVNPWALLAALQPLRISSSSAIRAVAEACARRRISKVAEQISITPLENYSSRLALYCACLETDAEGTIRHLSSFSANESETRLFKRFATAAQEPKKALADLKSDPIEGPDTRLALLRILAHKNPKMAVSALEQSESLDQETLKKIAIEIGKRNESLLFSTTLIARIPQEQDRFDIALKVSELDRVRLIQIVEKFDIRQQDFLARAASESAASDVSVALRSQVVKELFVDSQFRYRTFKAALLNGAIDNAFEIIKAILKAEGKNISQKNTLDHFDQLVATIAAEQNADNSNSVIATVSRIRRAGCIPSNLLYQAFEQFDDSTDTFITEVLSRAGNTFGSSIVKQLRAIYRSRSHLPQDARAVVELFLRSGFRGFDRNSFNAVRKAYSESAQAATQLLQHWTNTSSAILRGSPINPKLLEQRNFAALVYAAYRPVGMSIEDVREHLAEVPDHSEHLSKWKHPKDGYQLAMSEQSQISVARGQSLDFGRLNELSSMLLRAFESEATEHEFQSFLVRAAQRATQQVDRSALIAFLRSRPDPRVKGLLAEINSISRNGVTTNSAYSFISKTSELLNVIDEVLQAEVHFQFSQAGFSLSAKTMRHIAQVMRKAEAELPTLPELEQFILEQLLKLFEKEHAQVKKELNKFEGLVSEQSRGLRGYLSKSKTSFFGRAGAGLCTYEDLWSWNNKDFLQINLIDEERERVVGNIQLHIFKDKKKRNAVLARPNPTEPFLAHVDIKRLASEVIRMIGIFADDNDLVPYLPDQHGGSHLLTNRGRFAPHITQYYGRQVSLTLKITESHSVNTIYEMKRRPED